MAVEKKTQSGGVHGRVRVRQIRSAIGRDARTRRMLDSIGLGRIGHEQELPNNPSIQAVLERISHVVTIDKV